MYGHVSLRTVSLVCGTCVTSVPRSISLVLSVRFSFTAPLKSNLTITVSGSARGRVQTVVMYKLQQALTRPCCTLSYLSVSTSSHPVWHLRTSECVWTRCLIRVHFFVFTGILLHFFVHLTMSSVFLRLSSELLNIIYINVSWGASVLSIALHAVYLFLNSRMCMKTPKPD